MLNYLTRLLTYNQLNIELHLLCMKIIDGWVNINEFYVQLANKIIYPQFSMSNYFKYHA